MKKAIIAATILAACTTDDGDRSLGGNDGQSGTTFTASNPDGNTGNTMDGGGIDSGSDGDDMGSNTGTDSPNGSDASSTESTSGTDGGDDSSTGEQSGTSGTVGTSSDTDPATTGGGQMRFPGDECDPFIDWCLAGYDCMQKYAANPIAFSCQVFNGDFGDGMFGSNCAPGISETRCLQGYLCTYDAWLPPGSCIIGTRCCAELCRYQETCPGGEECNVIIWQANLADYLVKYTGIGICPS